LNTKNKIINITYINRGIARMIVIYTIENCPYCTKAKEALGTINLEFKEILIEDKPLFKQEHNWDTFPLIYSGKTKVGGYNDLVAYFIKNDYL
jgi:glutaredoxin 3